MSASAIGILKKRETVFFLFEVLGMKKIFSYVEF